MRKGYKLEAQIQKVLDYVNSIGYHAHKNNPRRTVDGVYLEGEPFDYEIMTPMFIDCFDAKEVKGEVWAMHKKDIMQAEHLKHAKNAGIRAYFLIQFGAGTYPLMIDIDSVIDLLKRNIKSIPMTLGKRWDVVEVLKNDSTTNN